MVMVTRHWVMVAMVGSYGSYGGWIISPGGFGNYGSLTSYLMVSGNMVS